MATIEKPGCSVRAWLTLNAKFVLASISPICMLGCSDGITPPSTEPQPLRPVEATSISLGVNHACVVTSTGRLVCWGEGASTGRLSHFPARVRSVSANRQSTAVVTEADYAWLTWRTPSEARSEAYQPLPTNPFGTNEEERTVQAVALGPDGGCVLYGAGRLTCRLPEWGMLCTDPRFGTLSPYIGPLGLKQAS